MNSKTSWLKDIQRRLDFIDYSVVYQNIAEFRSEFLTTAILKEGHYIDRVRINKPGQIFKSQGELSYISNPDVLKNCKQFGRANEPHQSVFYGAVVSPEIKMPRAVAYFETSPILRNVDNIDMNGLNGFIETFTVSRWIIKKTIEVVEMVFSDDALKNSTYVKLAFENQIKNYLTLCQRYNLQVDIKSLIDESSFISNEFSKPVNNHLEYKISSAYINYIWKNTPFKGITYPSVQSMFRGQNVALLPEVVDEYLELEKVGMCVFERRNGENSPIPVVKLAEDLGVNNSDFKWKDVI